MNFVGIDLHKKSITVCVVNQARKELACKTLACTDPERIQAFFAAWGPFTAVMEATASYEWLWQLLEPLAQRLVLAHPKKLRVIAESTRKSDRLDARVLAQFLALDMIPAAYRPTPRQRQHRVLVRQRYHLRRRTTSVKNKIRHLLSNYNADRPDLFGGEGMAWLKQVALSAADRFVLEQLLAELLHHEQQMTAVDKELRAFAKRAPAAEKETRAALRSIPAVGPVTIDVMLSEIGTVERFRSLGRVSAYAGLAPGQRESAGRSKQLGISKEGSRLLRWALVEAAWRLKRRSRHWAAVFERLQRRCGRKKAIVAIARRLLGVMVAVWRSGQRYRLLAEPPRVPAKVNSPS
jgi:transposase